MAPANEPFHPAPEIGFELLPKPTGITITANMKTVESEEEGMTHIDLKSGVKHKLRPIQMHLFIECRSSLEKKIYLVCTIHFFGRIADNVPRQNQRFLKH